MLGSKAYDALKPLAQIWLPAAGAAYFSLAQIWHLPNAEEIVGTVTIIDTFLGVVLGLSSKSFNNPENVAGRYDGVMLVQNNNDSLTYQMHLNDDPAVLADKNQVTFKIAPIESVLDHPA